MKQITNKKQFVSFDIVIVNLYSASPKALPTRQEKTTIEQNNLRAHKREAEKGQGIHVVDCKAD